MFPSRYLCNSSNPKSPVGIGLHTQLSVVDLAQAGLDFGTPSVPFVLAWNSQFHPSSAAWNHGFVFSFYVPFLDLN